MKTRSFPRLWTMSQTIQTQTVMEKVAKLFLLAIEINPTVTIIENTITIEAKLMTAKRLMTTSHTSPLLTVTFEPTGHFEHIDGSICHYSRSEMKKEEQNHPPQKTPPYNAFQNDLNDINFITISSSSCHSRNKHNYEMDPTNHAPSSSSLTSKRSLNHPTKSIQFTDDIDSKVWGEKIN